MENRDELNGLSATTGERRFVSRSMIVLLSSLRSETRFKKKFLQGPYKFEAFQGTVRRAMRSSPIVCRTCAWSGPCQRGAETRCNNIPIGGFNQFLRFRSKI